MRLLDEWKQNRLKRAAQPLIDSAVDEVARNYATQLRIAESNMGKPDDLAFRRLSAFGQDENLDSMDQEQLTRIAMYLYYNNGIFKRLTQIPIDFCYRITVKAEEGADEKLQEIIDDFWLDPYNNLPEFMPQFLERYLNIDGEFLLPAETNPQTGHVTVKFEEPRNIKTLKAFKDDKRYIDEIEMRKAPGEDRKVYRVIRYQSDPGATMKIGEATQENDKDVSAVGFRVGTAFYFRRNHLVLKRGRPDMEPIIDMIDAHDNALFDQIRNRAFQGAFSWDTLLIGAKQAEIDAYVAAHPKPPKPGSERVHNEKEVHTTVGPSLHASDDSTFLTQIRKVLGLGAGRSESWVAASDDVNRSTAEVADTPPLRNLEREQWNIENMVRFMVDFAIDMAIVHGTYKIDPKDKKLRAFSVEMPDLVSTDDAKKATALKDMADGLSLAVEADFIDIGTARNAMYSFLNTPMPVNLEEMIAKAEQDDAAKGYLAGGDLADRLAVERSEQALPVAGKVPPQLRGGKNAKSADSKPDPK